MYVYIRERGRERCVYICTLLLLSIGAATELVVVFIGGGFLGEKIIVLVLDNIMSSLALLDASCMPGLARADAWGTALAKSILTYASRPCAAGAHSYN